MGEKAVLIQKRKAFLNFDGAQRTRLPRKTTGCIQRGAHFTLDPGPAEKLPRGVPSTLLGWPSYKPRLLFSFVLSESIFAKVLQIAPQGNVITALL